MAGSRWFRILPVCILLWVSIPGAAWAKDFYELTVCGNDGELELKLHGEYEIPLAGPWDLALSATVPGRITSEDGAYAKLALSWTGEDWRWTAAGRFNKLSPARDEIELSLRGAYARPVWRATVAVTGARDFTESDNQFSASGTITGKLAPGLSLSYTRDYADVVNQDARDDNQYHASRARLSWRRPHGSLGLECGGTARLYADPMDDVRSGYAELSWSWTIGNGWSLAGGGKIAETTRYDGEPRTHSTKLDLSLTKRAPVGLKLQTEFLVDEYWRGGLTLSGKYGRISWRAGAVCKYEDTCAVWPFAVAGCRLGGWEAALGLTPKGEYAANSRQGYWATVGYVF